MRRFLIGLLLLIASASPALAWSHGAGAMAVFCGAYSGDNGCAHSRDYVAVPAYRDVNFALNSAQSGQLPPNPTPAQIANRTALLHTTNMNFAGWDYAIGSADPATLGSPNGINDANCQFVPNGFPQAGTGTAGPYLNCNIQANVQYVIKNVKLDDGAGNCVPIYIAGGQGVNSSLTLINVYAKNTGNCLGYNGGNPPAFIYEASNAGVILTKISLINVTLDGNFFALGYGATTGCLAGMVDNRSGAGSLPHYINALLLYTVFKDMCSISIIGAGTPSPIESDYSVYKNICMTGIQSPTGGNLPGCHGEAWEYTGGGGATNGGGVQRKEIAIGNIYTNDSSDWMTDTTTPIYCTSGNYNFIGDAVCDVENNLFVGNMVYCQNTAPYGPNTPCLSKTTGGFSSQGGIAYGLVAFQWASSIQDLYLIKNVVDEGPHITGGAGAGIAYAASQGGCTTPQPVGPPHQCKIAASPITSVVANAGTIDVAAPSSGYVPSNGQLNGTGTNWMISSGIADVNDNVTGFVPTTITGFNTYTNYISATVNATGSGYVSGTGVVTVKLTALPPFQVGDIVLTAVTGTGADLASANGNMTVTSVDTINNLITYTIATGKTITTITGGTVSSTAPDILTVAATGSSYTSGTGNVVLKITGGTLAEYSVGEVMVVTGLTGAGANLSDANGSKTITAVDVGNSLVTYNIGTGKTITSITGGTIANCTIGSKPGCGQVTIANTTEPAIASNFGLFQFAYIFNFHDGGNNYAIGTGTAKVITFDPQPWGPRTTTFPNRYNGVQLLPP